MKIFVLISIILTTALAGCGPKKPSDMPKLYPVQLTIVQEGTPLADANVALRAKESAAKYAAGGMTDSNGVVILHTHGQYKGVPEGEYTVIINKSETIKEGPWDQIPKDSEQSRTFMMQNQNKLKQRTYSLVNTKYGSPATSDLSITVTSSGVTETLDVGKKVRETYSSPLNP
ncbi:MAG: hypothetical protein Q4G68_12300 [Planctomycetia bacterium]|nr:hypothetical protein [Planctomycetia bacterium]